MPQVVVKQERFTGYYRQLNALVFGAERCQTLALNGAALGTRESSEMTTRHHLQTSRLARCVVESSPDLQAWRPVEAPELSVVLMPRKLHPDSGRLVPEHGAIKCQLLAEHGPGDTTKERILDPGREERIEFELLELAIRARRPNPACAKYEIPIVSGRRVVLKEEARIPHLSQHQGVRTRREPLAGVRREHRTETCVAVASERRQGRVEREMKSAGAEHVASLTRVARGVLAFMHDRFSDAFVAFVEGPEVNP